jgi:hypothetical protein
MSSSDALSSLIAAAQEAAPSGRPPPVHLWNPAHCGDIDIRIRRDGVWMHEGSPIGRPRLVRLFSTVLRRDPDGFHLVTPAEKLRITVDDAPFLAVRVDRIGASLHFLTNVGDRVVAGPEHGLRVETDLATGEPAPYLHVRAGLEARLTRAVFYELAEMGEEREGRLGIGSDGAWFDLGPLEADA